MASSDTTGAGTYELPADHPGFADPAYRARRAAIAAVGESFRPGQPIPDVEYTPDEDGVWHVVSTELRHLHRDLACAEYREGADRLRLPRNRTPQLREVDAHVHELTGWHVHPVPGLVPTRVFYGALAERRFLSTQYIRHHSVPFYTPEPDIVHEIIGHANALASPVYAELYQRAGEASLRARSEAALEFFSRVFWFSLEFGVVWEDGELRAYGAGLLSSYGELQQFRSAEIRPWDVEAMGTLDYDITRYQPVLFAGSSFPQVVADLCELFDRDRRHHHTHHVASPPLAGG
jgi:phenylalanine-4-hydroxylase